MNFERTIQQLLELNTKFYISLLKNESIEVKDLEKAKELAKELGDKTPIKIDCSNDEVFLKELAAFAGLYN